MNSEIESLVASDYEKQVAQIAHRCMRQKLVDDAYAADYLATTSKNLAKARCTGELFGLEAPPYVKLNKTVRYKLGDLMDWAGQFKSQSNTAQGI